MNRQWALPSAFTRRSLSTIRVHDKGDTDRGLLLVRRQLMLHTGCRCVDRTWVLPVRQQRAGCPPTSVGVQWLWVVLSGSGRCFLARSRPGWSLDAVSAVGAASRSAGRCRYCHFLGFLRASRFCASPTNVCATAQHKHVKTNGDGRHTANLEALPASSLTQRHRPEGRGRLSGGERLPSAKPVASLAHLTELFGIRYVAPRFAARQAKPCVA